jgi:hypothetical protein
MVICELLYIQLCKSPINSINKSKTRLICHANPGYVTIFNVKRGGIYSNHCALRRELLQVQLFSVQNIKTKCATEFPTCRSQVSVNIA